MAAAVVVTLAVLALGAWAWRSSNLSSARQELEYEVTRIEQHFEGAGDPETWYRQRIKGNWGGDELRSWSRQLEVRTGLADAPSWYADDSLKDYLLGTRADGKPDDAALRAFLDRTAAWAADANGLLSFDDLSSVPEIVDGQPSFLVFDEMTAVHVLCARAQALAAIGDFDIAWKEAGRLIDLADRLRTHSSLIGYLVHCSMIENALGSVELLASLPSGSRLGRAVAPVIPPDQLAAVAEGELALTAILFSTSKDRAALLDEWANQHHPTSGEWSSLGEGFNHVVLKPGLGYRRATAYLREAWAISHYRGGTLPTVSPDNAWIWGRAASGRTRICLARLRAGLLLAMRQAEAAGTPPEAIEPDPAHYADLTVSRDGEWLVVHFQPSRAVKHELRQGYAADDELFEPMPPLRFRPLKQ